MEPNVARDLTGAGADQVRLSSWGLQRLVTLVSVLPIPVAFVVIGRILDEHDVHLLPWCLALAGMGLVGCVWAILQAFPTVIAGDAGAIEVRRPFRDAVRRPVGEVSWRYQSYPPMRYMLPGSFFSQDITICLLNRDRSVFLDCQNRFSTAALTSLTRYLQANSVERADDLLGRRF